MATSPFAAVAPPWPAAAGHRRAPAGRAAAAARAAAAGALAASQSPPSPAPARAAHAADADGGASDRLSCDHFGACSGCTLRDSLHAPPLLAAAHAWAASLGLSAPMRVHRGPVAGWRTRARLAVRPGPGGSALLGLFAAGSHDVVPIPRCAAHHPRVNAAFAALAAALEALPPGAVAAYDEAAHAGGLRYAQATLCDASGGGETGGGGGDGAVELVLVWNAAAPPPPGGPAAPLPPGLAELAGAVFAAAPPGLLSALLVNWHPGRDNAVLGRGGWAWLRPAPAPGGGAGGGGGAGAAAATAAAAAAAAASAGAVVVADAAEAPPCWARFGGSCGGGDGDGGGGGSGGGGGGARPPPTSVLLPPAGFAQPNSAAFDALLGRMEAHVPPGARLVDLYAGSGAIGLHLLSRRGGGGGGESAAGGSSPPLSSLRALEVSPGAGRAFGASADATLLPGRPRLRSRAAMAVASAADGAAVAALLAGGGGGGGGGGDGDGGCGPLVVVVDPPRRGLDAATLALLCAPACAASALLYVSCGFPALRRDAAALARAGWALAHAEAFVFFPGVDALETLLVMKRGRR